LSSRADLTGLAGKGAGLSSPAVRRFTVVDTTTTLDTVKQAAGGRFERARLFLSEVRNELKRVTWPSQKEVYATTVVVILTSLFFGLYLALLDFGVNNIVLWLFRRFGAA
jgi:preprotein translocase subunit SecE